MIKLREQQTGFTIVELLIVIVVIGVLAAITTVAYGGIQARARDADRLNDARGITQSLSVDYLQNGIYPNFTYSAGQAAGNWEESQTELSGQFMEHLKDYGYAGGTPVDPINDGTYRYKYYKYGAGGNGCDPARGSYFVFVISKLEATSGTSQSSPGFSCTGRNWQSEGAWVTGGYER